MNTTPTFGKSALRRFTAEQVVSVKPAALVHEAEHSVPMLTHVLAQHPNLRPICVRFAACIGKLIYTDNGSRPALHAILERATTAADEEDIAEFQQLRFTDTLINSLDLILAEQVVGWTGCDWIMLDLLSERIEDWIDDNGVEIIEVHPVDSVHHLSARRFDNNSDLMKTGVKRMARNRLLGYESI